MKKKWLVGWPGLASGMVMASFLAASLLAASDLTAQINPLGSQAALERQARLGSTSTRKRPAWASSRRPSWSISKGILASTSAW